MDGPKHGGNDHPCFKRMPILCTTLGHTLLNPNQLRHNGITVNDNPFDTSPTRLSILAEGLVIPLRPEGTKIQFVSYSPSQKELNTCRHIHLTSPNEWNPKDVTLGKVYTDLIHVNQPLMDITPFISDSLLHAVDPVLAELKERALAEIRVVSHERTQDS